MRKIILSLSVIAFVAAIAIVGTMAYYTDTETSIGNTITAGSIDLKIDNECYYNGEKCLYHEGTDKYYWGGIPEFDAAGDISNQCFCAWMPEKDLVPGEDFFFMFHDLKPGDSGEDTLSLHVVDNDAWVCAEIEITKNDDMTCTEPELEADADPTCVDPGTNWDGDLAQELDFVFWLDDGDNVLEYDEEILMQGPITALPGEKVIFPIADSRSSIVGYDEAGLGLPFIGCETYYIGKAWCFGDILLTPIKQDGSGDKMSPNGPQGSGITCSGKLVSNASQSDTVMGNVSFTAVQYRNNTDYVCVEGPGPGPECVDDGDCNDDNECTADVCDANNICQNTCSVGQSCNDGNPYTMNDRCILDGENCICVGTPECINDGECNDGNICTEDICDANGVCQYNCLSISCDDLNPYTIEDMCFNCSCVGTPVECIDAGDCVTGPPCTTAACVENACVYTPICNGSDTQCGCTSCENCNDDDGWVNVGGQYTCCRGDYTLCSTCQNQEYIDYSCEGTSCVSATTNWQTIVVNPEECSTCFPDCCVNGACVPCGS